MNLANLYNITGHKQEPIGCQAMNTGLFATCLFSQRVAWIGAGSDAENDFAGYYHGMMMSYARKTGYGGKGSLPRGARVYTISKETGSYMKVNSYIINDS